MRKEAFVVVFGAVALIAAACNTTPPTSSKATSKSTARTAVDAAYEALALWNQHQPANPHKLDKKATLQLLAEQRHYSVDLSGPDRQDEIWHLALAKDNGENDSLVTADGNYLWTVLQQNPDGSYRPVYTRAGTGPAVLGSKHNGMADLVACWNEGANRNLTMLHFDGNTYKADWEGAVLSQENMVSMPASSVPDEVLADAVKYHFPALRTTGKIEMPKGAVFREDIDRDGQPELIIQINAIRADGRLTEFAPTGQHPENYFVYGWRDNKWVRLYAAVNKGPMRLPLRTNQDGVYCVQTQTGGTPISPTLRKVMLSRAGVQPGTPGVGPSRSRTPVAVRPTPVAPVPPRVAVGPTPTPARPAAPRSPGIFD